MEKNNIAIIDGSTLGWVSQAMNENIEILDFFDIASIVEAIVFHDKVQMVFPKEMNQFDKAFYDIAVSEFSSFIDQGIFEVIKFDNVEPKSDSGKIKKQKKKKDKKRKKKKKETILDADKDFTAWYMHTNVRFAYIDRFYEGNTVVLPRQSTIYKMNRRVKVEHSICNLYLNYKTVRELAQYARLASTGKTVGTSLKFWNLPIPPICLDALTKSNKLSDIWNVTGDLWDRYRKIRKAHQKITLNHGNIKTSPAKRERDAQKLKKDWLQLTSKWTTRLNSFKIDLLSHSKITHYT